MPDSPALAISDLKFRYPAAPESGWTVDVEKRLVARSKFDGGGACRKRGGCLKKGRVELKGGDPLGRLPAEFVQHGIHVRFAVDEGEADALLEDLIRRAATPRKLILVSDDHRIQRARVEEARQAAQAAAIARRP